MKRFITAILFNSLLLAIPLFAQEIDESFVFIDENGEVIQNGATVTRTVVELYDEETEVINSGISVKNVSAPASELIRMNYSIKQIDNGSYQICFPTSCNTQDAVGDYVTQEGTLMFDTQNIMSEWFPTADGMCVVELQIELIIKGGLPPKPMHKAWGPTLTLKFIKGDTPGPEPVKGDVNGDGEVNIADINSVIATILNPDVVNENADVNGDNEVNISDVNAVISIILSTL